MAINKVIDRNDNVLIDLTNDTVKPGQVLSGVKFHDNEGKEQIGMVEPNKLDSLKYTFIDYDGEILYTFTDAEIDAMTELPAGPDHTDENLTFQEWNWDLEDLKNWDRTRADRPIVGASLITSDEKTYITLKTTSSNAVERFYISSRSYGTKITVEFDFGDGTVQEYSTSNDGAGLTVEHTFPEADTEYTVIINPKENAENFVLGMTSNYSAGGRYGGEGVVDIKLGRINFGPNHKLKNNNTITKINIPNTTGFFGQTAELCNSKYYIKGVVVPKRTDIPQSFFKYCYSLSIVSLPNTIKSILNSAFYECYGLEYIVFPDSLETLESNAITNTDIRILYLRNDKSTATSGVGTNTNIRTAVVNTVYTQMFQGCWLLKNLVLVSPTTIRQNAFSNAATLQYIKIPDSVTSIGQYAFNGLKNCTIDLSEQTKVIPITSNIGSPSASKFLIPMALLDAYKSASYWSSLANSMVGV